MIGSTRATHRLARATAATVALVGLAYVSVIALWLLRVGTPREPIGDPYLLWMELLTIVSAAALAGLATALWSVSRSSRPLSAMGLLVAGTAGAVTTIGVHVVQLTAVRQMWRSGALDDYRLVWPSVSFAVEYLAWDVGIGLFMLFAARALVEVPGSARVRLAWTWGGVLCLVGMAGPISGAMAWQNLAVAGYAVLLPLGAAFLFRLLARPRERTARSTTGA